MRRESVKRLAAGVLIAAFAVIGSVAARAEDKQHMYCPVGSGLVCWIFGCWCEDSSLNRVASVDCTTLPPQQPWTWNANVDTTSACPPPAPPAGQSTQPKTTSP